MEMPDVGTIDEVAKIIGCPVTELMDWRKGSKTLSSGPPFKVGAIALELMALGHLSTDVLLTESSSNPSDMLLSLAAHLLQGSLKQAALGDFIENLSEDTSLKKVLATGDEESLKDALRMTGRVKAKIWEPVDYNDRIVVAVARPKTAALFFDRVWTLDREIPGAIGVRSDDVLERFALGFLDNLVNEIAAYEVDDKKREEKMQKVDESLLNAEAMICKALSGLLETSLAKLTKQPLQTYYASEENLKTVYEIGSTPMIVGTIQTMQWIDEAELTWEHVREIRSDLNSTKQLKRMLHWLDSDMVGKPLSFIADEIEIRLENYRQATEKHGIKLANRAFGTFLDAKLLNTLLGTLLGGQIHPERGALVGFLGGLALQGVRVVFETLNLHCEQNANLQSNPVAYLHSVKSCS